MVPCWAQKGPYFTEVTVWYHFRKKCTITNILVPLFLSVSLPHERSFLRLFVASFVRENDAGTLLCAVAAEALGSLGGSSWLVEACSGSTLPRSRLGFRV